MKLNTLIRFAGRSCSALAMFGMALAADPLLTNTTVFRIPFAVDGATTNVSGSAVLFAGVNDSPLEQVQTVDASSGGFKFNAPSDGKYSFAVRMTDSSGNLVGNEESLIPELQVVVDTIAPRLTFQLSDMGDGKVNVNWNTNETSVDPGSLRLEYAEGADGRWKPISATSTASGQASITVQSGTSIEVRGYISDLAGNQGTGSAQTVVSRVTNTTSQLPTIPNNQMTIPGNNQAVGPSTFTVRPQQQQQPEQAQAFAVNSIPTPAQNNSYATPLNTAPAMTGMAAPQGFTEDNYGSTTPSNVTYATPPPVNNYVQAQTANSFSQPANSFAQPPQAGYGQQPPMQIGGQSGFSSNTPGFRTPGAASGSRQIVGSQVFNIDYRVDDVGASGVSDVELFVTENNGRDWFRYGNDLDLQTPFEVDTRGEGTFGFAVRASNGLGFRQPAPQPGEQPNIVVTVDKTAPMVELGRPQVIVANGGKIRMAWRVSEPNPSDSPIRLEYSPSNSGPWTPLFDWQVDQGGYEMAIQPGMPQSMHFRLLARDVAGNVTASQTNQPVLIDQRRPTARLLRVQPVSNGRRFGL